MHRAVRSYDLTNKTFGKLTAAWPVGRKVRATYWLCFCECGRRTLAGAGHLRNSESRGCSFCHKETHKSSKTKEYRAYSMAKHRCTNPNSHCWKDYGGRGIKFLFESFQQFISELGPKPYGLTLDRTNNEGNYEPGNVRWATRSQQQMNRRKKCSHS